MLGCLSIETYKLKDCVFKLITADLSSFPRQVFIHVLIKCWRNDEYTDPIHCLKFVANTIYCKYDPSHLNP